MTLMPDKPNANLELLRSLLKVYRAIAVAAFVSAVGGTLLNVPQLGFLAGSVLVVTVLCIWVLGAYIHRKTEEPRSRRKP